MSLRSFCKSLLIVQIKWWTTSSPGFRHGGELIELFLIQRRWSRRIGARRRNRSGRGRRRRNFGGEEPTFGTEKEVSKSSARVRELTRRESAVVAGGGVESSELVGELRSHSVDGEIPRRREKWRLSTVGLEGRPHTEITRSDFGLCRSFLSLT